MNILCYIALKEVYVHGATAKFNFVSTIQEDIYILCSFANIKEKKRFIYKMHVLWIVSLCSCLCATCY